MAKPIKTLLPYVLDYLTNKKTATDIDEICDAVIDAGLQDYTKSFRNVKSAVEFSLALGNNLGLISLKSNRFEMAFNKSKQQTRKKSNKKAKSKKNKPKPKNLRKPKTFAGSQPVRCIRRAERHLSLTLDKFKLADNARLRQRRRRQKERQRQRRKI